MGGSVVMRVKYFSFIGLGQISDKLPKLDGREAEESRKVYLPILMAIYFSKDWAMAETLLNISFLTAEMSMCPS